MTTGHQILTIASAGAPDPFVDVLAEAPPKVFDRKEWF